MTTATAARLRLMMAVTLAAAGCALGLLSDRGPSRAYAAPNAQPDAKADPLQPKNLDEVATGFAACRACHNEKLPIDPKDNDFAKLYKSHEFVLLNEGRTWRQQDPHSAAFRVLSEPLGQQMSKILKYDVTKAPQCLTCHSIDKMPGAPLPKDETEIARRFEAVPEEGVTCNACHGLRSKWQSDHYKAVGGTIPWRTHSPAEKEQAGMRNLRDPVVRAKFCASCHVGDPDTHRVVTHDMYAAGHPPLPPFEIGMFMECQPKHWGYPTDPALKFFTDEGFKTFKKTDKTPDNWRWELYRFHPADQEVYMARQITAGAVASLHAEMKQLAADAEAVARGDEGAVDFARFDCFACHHDLKYPSDRQARGYAGPPGRPPLKAWTAALPGVVIEHSVALKPFAETSKGFRPKWDAVHTAALARPFGKPKELAAAARELVQWCEDYMHRHQTEANPVYTREEANRLLSLIGDAALSKEWTADPEAAMHLTWAYLSLRGDMKKDINKDMLNQLGKTIPVRVREEPFSDQDNNPKTVGATLRQRLDVFSKFDSKDFTGAFRELHGKQK